MCLAIPGRISALEEDREFATVDVTGVRRRVNVALLADMPLEVGDWVLIHVGFAMSRISDAEAAEQLRLLAMLGEEEAAIEEILGYDSGPEISAELFPPLTETNGDQETLPDRSHEIRR